MNKKIYTIGHSSHSIEGFITILKQHNITKLCDVRSTPYSRRYPQYNRETLEQELNKNNISYRYLGGELGARNKDAKSYMHGKIEFDCLVKNDTFKKGILLLMDEMKNNQIAIMCAEKDPIECHRSILVARYLEKINIAIDHILDNGKLESHPDAINRLLRKLKLPEHDMFRSHEDMIDRAYNIQSKRIAYDESKEPTTENNKKKAF